MTDLDTTSQLYAARPRLLLDGEESAELAEVLLRLSVCESTVGLFCCELAFTNWGDSEAGEVGFAFFDRDVFDFGRGLKIEMGEGDAEAQIFDGRISGLEGRYGQQPPELVVLAEDRFQDLRMVRRSRTFEDVDDEQVFQSIAGEHGLTPDLDVDGPSYRVLAQVNQSDLAFLRERARAIDAELWLEGTTLHAQARSRRTTAELSLTMGQRLREFTVLADLARQRTSLTVSGWDVGAKEGIEFEATSSAIQSELNGDLGGSGLLQDSFGSRQERIVHRVPLSLGEAQSLAESEYRRMARRFLTGRGVAEGDGRLRAGSQVELRGLGPLFDGDYYVTEVSHAFDASEGFRTTFRVERPGMGEG